jgi:hypothetical protein
VNHHKRKSDRQRRKSRRGLAVGCAQMMKRNIIVITASKCQPKRTDRFGGIFLRIYRYPPQVADDFKAKRGRICRSPIH